MIKENEILVTGGTGMVGYALKWGHAYGNGIPGATFISSKDYDLRDKKQVEEMFLKHKPKYVIHLAARVGGVKANSDFAADFYYDNIMINTNVLHAAKEHNVSKLISLLSTCIYPDKVDSYPMKEEVMFNGPPTPTNFSYGYAKRCLAVQIDAYNKQFGTKYNYLIPCNLYGDYDNMHDESKMHFITALLNKIRNSKDKTLHLLGTGKPLRQFMYAGDLAAIIKLVIDNDITENFNVAPNFNYSIDEMAKIALEVTEKDYEIIYDRPELDGQFRKDVSNNKLLKIFPLFKFTGLKEGLKQVYDKIS